MVASGMHRTPVHPFRHVRYLCFDEEKWCWRTVQWLNVTLCHNKQPRAQWLAVLGELGHGSHGTVWHACTASGIGCAIKFQRRDEKDAEDRLRQECDRWNKHNIHKPFAAKVVPLAGKLAMMMPYMHKLSNSGIPLTLPNFRTNVCAR